MAKTAFILRLTSPSGASKDINVRPSTSIRMEEQVGFPIWARLGEGYVGALPRFGYEVGREDGFVPPTVTFDEFVDADPGWVIDIINPPAQIPAAVDLDADPEAVATGE